MINLERIVKNILIYSSNIHINGGKKNIFLFSTPRSGSTWLMELIASQPGFKYYDEPLNIRRNNVQNTNFFDNWDKLLAGSEREDIIISYLKKLEANKVKCMNPPPFRRNHSFFTTRIIFKIHEIEHLINKIRDCLNAEIIFLLRHPIATTTSRHVFPRLEYFVESEYYKKTYFSNEQIKFIDYMYKNGNTIEKGILSWCFQNFLPLNYLDHKNWIIITYEEIILNPYKTCKMLFNKLSLTKLDKMLNRMSLPAANIDLSTKETISIMKERNEEDRKRKLIKKWRNKVSEEKKDKLFEILSVFNIDTYCKDKFIANENYLNFNDTNEIYNRIFINRKK